MLYYNRPDSFKTIIIIFTHKTNGNNLAQPRKHEPKSFRSNKISKRKKRTKNGKIYQPGIVNF